VGLGGCPCGVVDLQHARHMGQEIASGDSGCAMSSQVRQPQVTRASEEAPGSQMPESQEHPAVMTKTTRRLLGPHSASMPKMGEMLGPPSASMPQKEGMEHPAVITKATRLLLGQHSASLPEMSTIADKRGACM
jgi:hypothetical protein